VSVRRREDLGQAQADEHARRHRRLGHDPRHDRAVGDAEIADAVDPEPAVDHGPVVTAHPAGTGRVEVGRRPVPDEVGELWVRDGVAPATLTLPVPGAAALSVAPFDRPAGHHATTASTATHRYAGYATTYRPDAALWCTQDGPALRCSRRVPH
jgi:hypothetical protein